VAVVGQLVVVIWVCCVVELGVFGGEVAGHSSVLEAEWVGR